MSRPTRAQLLYAVLLAPSVAPAVYFAGMMAYTLARAAKGLAPVPTARDVREELGFEFIFGAAVAYVATLAALPAVLWLRHAGRFARGPVIALGAVVGLITARVLAPQLRTDAYRIWLPWWMGAAMGTVCAAVFWRVANGIPPVLRERMESPEA